MMNQQLPEATDLLFQAIRAHVELFNESVGTGSWDRFVESLHNDPRMTFEPIPVSPFIGRYAIATAYREMPPTDTMSISSVDVLEADTVSARFAWDTSGDTGELRVSGRDDRVTAIEVIFDAP